jgi:uncharacterized membrane protein (DUF106 family)
MSFINSALRPLFDGILFPVRNWSPLLSLAILSLVIGIAMLIVFKHTSNQKGLADIKRRIHAGLFEIRLFNDDPRAIFRAQGEILRHNLSYLRLSLVPMLWMIVPLFLVIAQLQFHYGYDGLVPGESTLVKVKLADTAAHGDRRPDVSLEAPPGLTVETPGVWVPSLNEVSWRIAAQDRGSYEMKLRVAGQDYVKSVQVTDAIVRRSPERFAPSWWKEALYPAEAPLPRDGAVESIAIAYPEREIIPVFGFFGHWIIVFFVLSMAFAFALRSRIGVTF